jgi:hypothetical protein
VARQLSTSTCQRGTASSGCSIPNEPLGTDYVAACGADGNGGLAASLNARLDEWDAIRHGQIVSGEKEPLHGTIDWLFREYKKSEAYLSKVAPRSRPDYERTMSLICDIKTKKDDRIGERRIAAITPQSADKIYSIIIEGQRGQRLRQGEKAVALCSRAWRVVHRLHPNEFDPRVPNPWEGVTKRRRTKKTKTAATRDEVYSFAWGCIEHGHPEAAAAAVICFEWLQRPENVLAGFIRWTDYRSNDASTTLRIEHHKTGAVVLHPLEESIITDGKPERVLYYADAEAVLAKLPRRGIPMILRDVGKGVAKLYSFSGMQKIVHTMRDKLGLPSTFTLDACRHGGMTELEEAGLTDSQGRALSAHKSQQAYEGYAKRTIDRALAATCKRHAHRLANAQRTTVQNGALQAVQNVGERTNRDTK